MKMFLGGTAAVAIAAALIAAPVLARNAGADASLVAATDAAAGAEDGSLKPLTFGSWGVDLGARDTSVKPGDDFDKYANGAWFARTEIPADQASAGVDYDVYNLTQRQLRQLVTGAPATSQVGGLYQSFMDEKRVAQLGTKPLMADIAAVAGIKDKSEMARFMAHRREASAPRSSVAVPMPIPTRRPSTSCGFGRAGSGFPTAIII